MAFHIRDSETDRLVRELAGKRGMGLTETVKEAVSEILAKEISASSRMASLGDRLRPLLDRVDAMPKSGLKADKQFFDDAWGEGSEA